MAYVGSKGSRVVLGRSRSKTERDVSLLSKLALFYLRLGISGGLRP